MNRDSKQNIKLSPQNSHQKSSTCNNSDLLEKMIGPAPEMDIFVFGALTKGLLDTGSAVSTMLKSFFDNFCPQPELCHVRKLVVSIADGSHIRDIKRPIL